MIKSSYYCLVYSVQRTRRQGKIERKLLHFLTSLRSPEGRKNFFCVSKICPVDHRRENMGYDLDDALVFRLHALRLPWSFLMRCSLTELINMHLEWRCSLAVGCQEIGKWNIFVAPWRKVVQGEKIVASLPLGRAWWKNIWGGGDGPYSPPSRHTWMAWYDVIIRERVTWRDLSARPNGTPGHVLGD